MDTCKDSVNINVAIEPEQVSLPSLLFNVDVTAWST